jgi:hypothetical protein
VYRAAPGTIRRKVGGFNLIAVAEDNDEWVRCPTTLDGSAAVHPRQAKDSEGTKEKLMRQKRLRRVQCLSNASICATGFMGV